VEYMWKKGKIGRYAMNESKLRLQQGIVRNGEYREKWDIMKDRKRKVKNEERMVAERG
jgi:hypothetical protein